MPLRPFSSLDYEIASTKLRTAESCCQMLPPEPFRMRLGRDYVSGRLHHASRKGSQVSKALSPTNQEGHLGFPMSPQLLHHIPLAPPRGEKAERKQGMMPRLGPAYCSYKRNDIIAGYAAITHEGLVRYEDGSTE